MYISNDDRMRKISDDIFEEAHPPADRKKALQWRRRFHHVRFTVKNVRALTYFRVNEHELPSLDDEATKDDNQINHWSEIKGEPNIRQQIVGVVDEEELDDKIYSFEKEDGEIYRAISHSPIQVALVGGDSIQDHQRIPDGVFRGSFWHVDYGPCPGSFQLEATIPTEQMVMLHRALRENPNSKIGVTIELLCFTYEVDDFLRDAHDSRTFVVEGMAAAPVSYVTVEAAPRVDLLAMPSSPSEEEDYPEDGDAEVRPEDSRTSATSLAGLLQAVSVSMSSSAQSTKRMTVAIWVLIVLVGLNLLNG